MTRDLHTKVGEKAYDNLFASTQVPALVRAGTIAKGSAETTYKRGTLLEKDSSGKLHILGTSTDNTPDCVLTDDVTVGTTADENVTVYISGDFNADKLIVKDNYTITEANKDALRTKGILIGSLMA